MIEALQQKLFHLFAEKSLSRPPDWEERRLKRGFASTQIFFDRFDNRIDIEGNTFLDFGCGLGATCIYLGLRSAKRVIGVDINESFIRFANGQLVNKYPQLKDRVSFKLLEELADEKFDCIISKDSFEHYEDPAAILEVMRQRLKEGGKIYLGFAPLWKSPYGAHMEYVTKLPWAHIIFPEKIILAERKRLTGEDIFRFEDVRGGLNRMTVRRFREILANSNLTPIYLAFNKSDSRAIKIFNLLRRLSFCEEYFTVNAYTILQKDIVPMPKSERFQDCL